jgi:hypothetical protein
LFQVVTDRHGVLSILDFPPIGTSLSRTRAEHASRHSLSQTADTLQLD